MMRVFGGALIGLFFLFGGLLLEGGHVSSMMQLTAALIVIGGASGALLIAYPASTVWKSFVLALTGREAMRSAYLDAAKVFRSFGDLTILTGFVGVVFGIIHVLENLQAPDMIGPGLAVALVSILYGLLARLFIGKPLYDSFIARVYPSRLILDLTPETRDDDGRLTA